MAVSRRNRPLVGYGLDNALQGLSPLPIISKRNPSSRDSAELSTLWVNSLTNAYFVLTSVNAGAAVWSGQSTGSGTFASVEITGVPAVEVFTIDAGNAFMGGDLHVDGDTDIAGSLDVVSGSTLSGPLSVQSTSTITLISPAANGVTIGNTIQSAGIFIGTGTPNGTLTAPQGSLYLNVAGSGVADRLFVNTSGAMVWTNFVSAA